MPFSRPASPTRASIRVETEAELHETLTAVTAAVPAKNCWAAPSTALLYLPRHAAFEKLATLASAAHRLEGRGGIVMKSIFRSCRFPALAACRNRPIFFKLRWRRWSSRTTPGCGNAKRQRLQTGSQPRKRLGIDVLVDGEQYRRSMTTYFLEGWGCADIDPDPVWVLDNMYGQRAVIKRPATAPRTLLSRLVPLRHIPRTERRKGHGHRPLYVAGLGLRSLLPRSPRGSAGLGGVRP